MERLSVMIVVVMWATAESMMPTPLQKTIDGLFKSDARPHTLEESDMDDSEYDDVPKGNHNYNYELATHNGLDEPQYEADDMPQYDIDDLQDDDRNSLFADEDSYSQPSSRRFSDNYPTRPNARAAAVDDDLYDDHDLGYQQSGMYDDDDVDYQDFKPTRKLQSGREASSRVREDITSIRSKLPSLHLSDVDGTIENMAAIVRDAEELGSDTLSPARREKLKKATELRMTSLRAQLGSTADKGGPLVTEVDSKPLRKVNEDISQLEEKLETLHLPASTMSEATNNLKQIEKNAKELINPSISRTRKDHLKEANNLRMQALRKEMKSGKASPSFPGEGLKDLKVANIDRDVANLKDKVNAMDMSTELREEALTNLARITKDAHRISQTHGASRERLQKAMKLRTEALRDELKSSNSPAVTRPQAAISTPLSRRVDAKVSKVDDDLADVLQEIDAVRMPSWVAREARENIAAIKRDTHKIIKTHGKEHQKLEEAIKLRTRALKQELGMNAKGVVDVPVRNLEEESCQDVFERLKPFYGEDILNSDMMRVAIVDPLLKESDTPSCGLKAGSTNGTRRHQVTKNALLTCEDGSKAPCEGIGFDKVDETDCGWLSEDVSCGNYYKDSSELGNAFCMKQTKPPPCCKKGTPCVPNGLKMAMSAGKSSSDEGWLASHVAACEEICAVQTEGNCEEFDEEDSNPSRDCTCKWSPAGPFCPHCFCTNGDPCTPTVGENPHPARDRESLLETLESLKSCESNNKEFTTAFNELKKEGGRPKKIDEHDELVWDDPKNSTLSPDRVKQVLSSTCSRVVVERGIERDLVCPRFEKECPCVCDDAYMYAIPLAAKRLVVIDVDPDQYTTGLEKDMGSIENQIRLWAQDAQDVITACIA